jgi:rhodanese-related sulfurtransferase
MRRIVKSGLLTLVGFATASLAAGTAQISSADLEARLAAAPAEVVVLDVRSADEYGTGHVPAARNIPLDELEMRIGELAGAEERDIVVYCRTGRRAGAAIEILAGHGFRQLLHLEGDMPGWSEGGRTVSTAATPAAP